MIRQNAIARLLAAAAPLAAALFLAPAAPAAADEIRVMSDRTPSHLEPLFARYQETTGVKISPVFVEKGLVSRVQARPTEADVIITSTADILEKARRDGLLRPIASDVVKALDDRYRGPDDTYVIDAYRARAIYVSRDRVKPGTVTRYEDLLKPEWKGRVCIRSGYHRYNMALFAQMIADRGEAWTRDFMTRLRDNLARKPKGNDRNQVRGIYENVCDVAIANSYYMPIMLSRDDQRAWGQSARVVFPDQDGKGSYVLTSGVALTKADRAVDAATKFVEFLVSNYGQTAITNTTYEFPVIGGVALPEPLMALGKEEAGVSAATFKSNFVPLGKIEDQRAKVTAILDEINFDQK